MSRFLLIERWSSPSSILLKHFNATDSACLWNHRTHMNLWDLNVFTFSFVQCTTFWTNDRQRMYMLEGGYCRRKVSTHLLCIWQRTVTILLCKYFIIVLAHPTAHEDASWGSLILAGHKLVFVQHCIISFVRFCMILRLESIFYVWFWIYSSSLNKLILFFADTRKTSPFRLLTATLVTFTLWYCCKGFYHCGRII